jgi:hypothetical protein
LFVAAAAALVVAAAPAAAAHLDPSGDAGLAAPVGPRTRGGSSGKEESPKPLATTSGRAYRLAAGAPSTARSLLLR